MRSRSGPPACVALVALVAFVALVAVPAAAQRPDGEPRESWSSGVVGLQISHQSWDQDRPWAKRPPGFRSASAVMIDERHFLTGAQMIADATFVGLETFGRPRPVELRVAHVDVDVNLALLTVDDPAELDGLRPVEVAAVTPVNGGTLRTVRWRRQRLEAAATAVIRFDVERSATGLVHHAFAHLRSDMDGGGWSEPVFDGDTLVGLTVSQSQQTSRAVPAGLLTRYLDQALGRSAPVGFSALGVKWQVNRDSAVSRLLGQRGEPRGVLVRQVPAGTTGCGVLRSRDILLEIDGHEIDADGYYLHPRLGRLKFDQIFAERDPGSTVPLRVLREGRERAMSVTARRHPVDLHLVPLGQADAPPFEIAGGLVLRELDVPYLQTWGGDWIKDAPPSLASRYVFRHEAQRPERRRFVVIVSVLPSAYTIGYQQVRDVIVERINGRSIGSLDDVAPALAGPLDGYHVFELSPDAGRGTIVLDASRLDAATTEVLEEYGVPLARRTRARPLPPIEADCPGEF